MTDPEAAIQRLREAWEALQRDITACRMGVFFGVAEAAALLADHDRLQAHTPEPGTVVDHEDNVYQLVPAFGLTEFSSEPSFFLRPLPAPSTPEATDA